MGGNDIESNADMDYYGDYMTNDYDDIEEDINMAGIVTAKKLEKERLAKEQEEEARIDAEKIEKFLMKWQHLSYLHVSWESEEDIVHHCGAPGKSAISRYLNGDNNVSKSATESEDEPEDQIDPRKQQYFDPQYITIDRVLDREQVEEEESEYEVDPEEE